MHRTAPECEKNYDLNKVGKVNVFTEGRIFLVIYMTPTLTTFNKLEISLNRVNVDEAETVIVS